MAAIDDLKAAIGKVSASVSAEIKAVGDKITALSDADGVSAADAEELATQLNTISDNLDAETKTLTS